MRAMLIVGVVLLGLGIASLLGVLSFSEKKEVLKIGEFEASVQRERSVPQWAGIALIVAGTALAVAGLSRRR